MTTGRGVSCKGAIGFIALVLAAGAASADIGKHTLTINVMPPGAGTVSGAGEYCWLHLVRIEAEPKAECSFTGWTGDLTGDDNPACVFMTDNKTITATFADNGAPKITQCAANRTIMLDASCTAVMPDFTSGVAATDNVTPAQDLVITQSPEAGTPVGMGSSAVNITVRDAAGHAANCTATLTVVPPAVPATPVAPLVTSATVSTLDVKVMPDGNGSNVEYALFCAATGMWVQADGTFAAQPAWQTKEAWGTVTVAGLDECTAYDFSAVARNCHGDESAAGPAATLFTRDVTPPTGTIVINNNRSATNSYNVTLALTWDDGAGSGAVRMRFSDDGAHWTLWEPLAATRAYTLPAGPQGHRTVRVQFLDRANNRSAVYNDYIRLDTDPPTGSILINNGAMTTKSHTVTLNLTYADSVGGSGVARMRFSDDGAHWTLWEQPLPTRTHVLPEGLGYRTVRVQYRDGGDNVSEVYRDYIKVIE